MSERDIAAITAIHGNKEIVHLHGVGFPIDFVLGGAMEMELGCLIQSDIGTTVSVIFDTDISRTCAWDIEAITLRLERIGYT